MDKKQHVCLNCPVANLCLPTGLSVDDINKLDDVVQEKISLQPGELLFQIGEQFDNFYAISEGSLKNYILTEDGREQIHGFYFSSEMIGLDAVDTGSYRSSAKALEATRVCVIPFASLLDTANKLPSLQKQIITLMSQRLRIDMSLPRNSDAKERLAAFLLNISARANYRKNTVDFILPMPRADIANHLGLAVETVSRTISYFHAEGILSVQGKHLHINDFRQLQKLACP